MDSKGKAPSGHADTLRPKTTVRMWKVVLNALGFQPETKVSAGPQ